MRWVTRLLAAIALTTAVAANAQSEGLPGGERIRRFTSDVAIQHNGDLDVTETIRIVSQGDEIKRGIQRDFPTRYASEFGQQTNTGFQVLSVKRDGQVEPYALIGQSNGMRVRIGRADTMLPIGEHVYEIRYRTTRQIKYGDTADELYWNVTGNGWTFPIDVAEVQITLPQAAGFGARAVYTGPQGSQARDASLVTERAGAILFRTTAPLPRGSGFTVAVAFPKIVLHEPSTGQRLHWWLNDWGALAAGLIALGLLLVYYFRAWLLVGRGPRPETVVPLFAPPAGLTAASTRYIWKMRADNRGFTAATIDLAVAGHIHIQKDADGWLSRGTTVLEKVDGGKPIAPPEEAMRDALFADADSVTLKQDNHATLQAAKAALTAGLDAAHAGRMFDKHRDWATFGMLAIATAIMAAAIVSAASRWPNAYPTEMKAGLYAIGLFVIAWVLHRMQRTAASMSWLPKLGSYAAAIGGVFVGFGAVTGALMAGAWPVLLPLLAVPIGLSAFSWLYAPTPEGRVTMDHIAGFRQYLAITEEARLDTLTPPEKTPELFERYLPYAIALDVENRWAQKFSGVLAAAAAAGTTAHSLSWYSGSGDAWSDPGGFAGSMGASLASSISSASSSPSSSSGGSSGGGSSGGGGGGGGGSGW